MAGQPEIESSENLSAMEDRLRNHLYEEAWVKDPDTGYVVLPSVSLLINTEMQEIAAELMSQRLRQSGIQFDVALGIPNAGNYFGNALATKLNLSIVPGRKYPYENKEDDEDEDEGEDEGSNNDNVPGSWDNTVTIGPVPSFTTGVESMFAFNIEGSPKVLLMDDVIAEGNTMSAIALGLNDHRIEVVGAASYIAKTFQGGGDRLDSMGIRSFFAVGIERLEKVEGIWMPKLTPPQFPPK